MSKSSHAWRQYYAIAAAVGLGPVHTYIVYGNNIIIFTGAGTTVLIIILFKTWEYNIILTWNNTFTATTSAHVMLYNDIPIY